MSGLKERLGRLRRADSPKKPAVRASELGEEWRAIGAELTESDEGSFIRRVVRYPLEHEHGIYRLGDLLEDVDVLQAFHPGESVAAETMLFFDTETTGLGIGAGNVPFMMGLGYYESDAFVVEQLFIRNPAEERAMLDYFNGLFARFRYLVSYNGRTFDWPIVKNRYIMNRLELERDDAAHLDFLYPSRSLWRHTMESCRLGKVEEARLGYIRADDVPGSLAPMLYFRYLAEGDPEIVRGVFVHNEQDILSLAGLAIHFGRALNGKLNPHLLEAEELFRLGLWLDKMGNGERAAEMLALLLDRTAGEAGDYWIPLAAYYKKKGDLPKAVALWHQAVQRQEGNTFGPVEPLVELAMFYEHKAKDHASALGYAERALRLLDRRGSLERKSAKQRAEWDALIKRVDRLKRKQNGVDRRHHADDSPFVQALF